MAGGPWRIEGVPGTFHCFAKVTDKSWRRSLALYRGFKQQGVPEKEARKRAAVLVRYVGRRRQKPIRHIDRTNFLMYPGRRRDPKVDPDWWENRK